MGNQNAMLFHVQRPLSTTKRTYMVSTRVTKYELMEETAHQKLIIKVVEEGFLCYP